MAYDDDKQLGKESIPPRDKQRKRPWLRRHQAKVSTTSVREQSSRRQPAILTYVRASRRIWRRPQRRRRRRACRATAALASPVRPRVTRRRAGPVRGGVRLKLPERQDRHKEGERRPD